VDGPQVAAGAGLPDLRRYPVGAVQHRRPRRDLVDRVDEDPPQLLETLDHRPVVHDLVIDVQRRAEQLPGSLPGVAGHVDPGTEAARIGKDDLHRYPPGTAPLPPTPYPITTALPARRQQHQRQRHPTGAAGGWRRLTLSRSRLSRRT